MLFIELDIFMWHGPNILPQGKKWRWIDSLNCVTWMPFGKNVFSGGSLSQKIYG